MIGTLQCVPFDEIEMIRAFWCGKRQATIVKMIRIEKFKCLEFKMLNGGAAQRISPSHLIISLFIALCVSRFFSSSFSFISRRRSGPFWRRAIVKGHQAPHCDGLALSCDQFGKLTKNFGCVIRPPIDCCRLLSACNGMPDKPNNRYDCLLC